MIYLKLLWSFIQVGLFSVGGGYAAMPIIQSQVVDGYGWLSQSEFADLITIAEMTPGPIAVNSATFVGMRIAGVGGALIATLGCIMPALIIVTLLAFVYFKFKGLKVIDSVLACLRPAVVALIAGAGLSILSLVLFSGALPSFSNADYVNAVVFILALFTIRKFKLNPIIIMILCAVIIVGIYFIRLAFL